MKKGLIIKIIIGLIVIILIVLGIVVSLITEKEEENDNEVDHSFAVDVIVEIIGEVNRPGIYALPENALVSDVVILAKGFTNDAYTQDINLASRVEDGLKIIVKNKNEVNTIKKININNATLEQLKNLPGIADAKAQAIITYRETIGPYTCIEDIKKVSGISETIFNKIKDYITV